MMKIKVLKKIKGGKRNYRPGEIVELPNAQAKDAIQSGKAEQVRETESASTRATRKAVRPRGRPRTKGAE